VGERRSPWQRPQELPNKLYGIPFIKMENRVVRKNTSSYPFPPFSTKPNTPHEVGEELSIDMVRSLFRSSLHVTPGILNLSLYPGTH
jgi:hypothetical protein